MTIRISTGLANYLLGTGSLKAALTNCHIDFYDAGQATSPDDPPNGNLLASATINGGAFTEGSPTNGLNFDNPVGRVLSKAALEVWKIKCSGTGTIASFRIKANAVDNNLSSTTLIRIDGNCGITVGSDMRLGTVDAVPNKLITIESGDLRLPLAV